MSSLFVGQARGRGGEVARVERQLHAVVGLRDGLDEQAAGDLAGGHLRAFAVDVVAVAGFDRQRHVAAEDERIVGERRGNPPQPRFPVLESSE